MLRVANNKIGWLLVGVLSCCLVFGVVFVIGRFSWLWFVTPLVVIVGCVLVSG